ncbi:MAG: hypothetical protein H5T68_12615 [Chloroflexi bacterium]|nr:hypothetical protein [Chloroflexota bacterium]
MDKRGRRTVVRLEQDGLDLTGLEDLSGVFKIPGAWTAAFAIEPARD